MHKEEASAKDEPATVKDQVVEVKDQAVEMFEDFEHEVEREAHSPHDLSQGDKVVRKHMNGLIITFFTLIALALLAVIVVGRLSLHH